MLFQTEGINIIDIELSRREGRVYGVRKGVLGMIGVECQHHFSFHKRFREADVRPYLVVQKVGENVKLGKSFEISGDVIGSYVHDGKSGALVSLKGGSEELAKDLAMQITAMNPEYKTRAEIPADMIEKAKEIFKEEVENSGKPEDIKAKMMEGKVNAYFKDLTLMDQSFFKNPDLTVAKLLEQGKAEIVNYTRVSIK